MNTGEDHAHPQGAGPDRAIGRREAVRRIALLMGGAIVGSGVLLGAEAPPEKKPSPGFGDADLVLLDEIGETIVPATDIPGAKAVGIGAFMAMMVRDCYNDGEHAAFRQGLVQIDEACRARYKNSFLDCTPDQRLALANALDAEQRAYNETRPKDAPPHYFRMMKELTLLGYFSSEIGCTQAVRYIEVPGAFHGDIAYRKGDRAWF